MYREWSVSHVPRPYPEPPNTRLKLSAPVIYGKLAFVNALVWRRSLSAIR